MLDWITDYGPLFLGALATAIQTYHQTETFKENHKKMGITFIGLLYLFACLGLLGLVLQTHKKRVQAIEDKNKTDAAELKATNAEHKLDDVTSRLRDLQITANALPKSAAVDDLNKRYSALAATLGIKRELALATLNLSDQLGGYLAAPNFTKTLVPKQPNPNITTETQLQLIRERDQLRTFSIFEHFSDMRPTLKAHLDRLRSQGIDVHNAAVCDKNGQPTLDEIETCRNELRTIGNNLLR